jgi:hypothetical protein
MPESTDEEADGGGDETRVLGQFTIVTCILSARSP